jgi:hypothetical protein
VLSSKYVTLSEISIKDIRAGMNDLLYLSQTHDVSLSNLSVTRVLSTSASKPLVLLFSRSVLSVVLEPFGAMG